MELSNQYFRRIIGEIEIEENILKKEEKIYVALKKLEKEKNNLDSFQKFYLLGVLWYLMPYDSDVRDLNIEGNLLKSLDLNEDYIHSKVQLSYFYFDKKKYTKVIELLSNVDFIFFENNDQLWKSLKLQELLFVSKLNIVKKINAELIEEFIVLTTCYISIPKEELAVPIELIDSILKNKDKTDIEKLVYPSLKLINSTNQKEYFDDDIKRNLKLMLS